MQPQNIHAVQADSYDLKQAAAHVSGCQPTDEEQHLVEDLFLSLVKPVPRLEPSIVPSHCLNLRVMQDMLDSRQLQELRQATVGDPQVAGVATSVLADAALAGLQNLSQTQQDELETLANLVGDLVGLDGEHGPEGAQLDEALDEAAEPVRQALKAATKEALKNAQEALFIKELGGTWGTTNKGAGAPGLSQAALKQLIDFALGNPYLKVLMQMLGRVKQQATLAQQQITEGGVTPIGAELGDDISSLVPDEYLFIAIPEYQELFATRRINKELVQLKRESKQKLNDGPMVIVVDESGSMMLNGGARRYWASAVTFCYLMIGKQRSRPVRVIHMGHTRDGLDIDDFNFDGEAGEQELLRALTCVQHFFGGDNDFNYWTPAVIDAIEQDSRFGAADVALITDGGGSARAETLTAWAADKQRLGFKCLGVAIAPNAGDRALLEGFSDQVFTVSDKELTGGGDVAVLNALFSI